MKILDTSGILTNVEVAMFKRINLYDAIGTQLRSRLYDKLRFTLYNKLEIELKITLAEQLVKDLWKS